MTEIFDTALMMLDDDARPVILVPIPLPTGKTVLTIVGDGIDISIDDKIYGSLREMEEEELNLLALQTEVGMATFDADTDETLPETIQYIAQISDNRTNR